MMFNKQAYSEYLMKKTKNEKKITEHLWFLDELQKKVNENKTLSAVAFTAEIVDDFIKKQSWSYGQLDKTFSFLAEFATFIKKEQPELTFVATKINECCLRIFETNAKDSATKRKEIIRLIPDGVKINPEHLNGIDNEQFITCFRELQQLILNIYSDAEINPFEWGYPDAHVTGDAANNRISDFLLGIFLFSTFADDSLTVNAKICKKANDVEGGFRFAVRVHKKVEMIVDKLTDFGFTFVTASTDCMQSSRYDKKAESFTVSYPDNPLLLKVANIYANSQDFVSAQTSSDNTRFESFSYRWVEDPRAQKYEPIFHVKMDMSQKQTQEIQDWLHEKADEYGYKIDMKKPFDKGCVYYQKGSKHFIHVGDRDFGDENRITGNHDAGGLQTYTKVIFRDVFSSQPDKISALGERFPGVFGKGNPALCGRCGGRKRPDEACNMRIVYDYNGDIYENCAYGSFYFKGLTLDSFKDIFDLFLIEKKIKQPQGR